MNGFEIIGCTNEQYYSFSKRFDPYVVWTDKKFSSTLCGVEGWTLYECVKVWIFFKKWHNIIVNLFDVEKDKDETVKKRKFLQIRHPMHPDAISQFVLSQDIIYHNKKWYISFQKNGFYKTYTNAKDMLSKLNYNRDKIIDPACIDKWVINNKEILRHHFEVDNEPVENCMVFGDGEKLFYETRQKICGRYKPAFSLCSDYLKYSLKIIKKCYKNGMYPSWMNNMMKDVFPFKDEWMSTLSKDENALHKQDWRMAMHVLFYRFVYQRDNDIGLYVMGPTGTGKTHLYYVCPQEVYPEKFIKISTPDPNGWVEFPKRVSVWDDVNPQDKAKIRIQKLNKGEQAPRRCEKPKLMKEETYCPILLDNEIPYFGSRGSKTYHASRRFFPVFKSSQHEKIETYSSLINRCLYFLTAEQKSKMPFSAKLMDVDTYHRSPLLQQRYEAMKDFRNFPLLSIPQEIKMTTEYYFYAWVIINTKKTKNEGIDFRELCKVYNDKCKLNLDILVNVFKMNICTTQATHKHAAVYKEGGGETKLLLLGRTTILYE